MEPSSPLFNLSSSDRTSFLLKVLVDSPVVTLRSMTAAFGPPVDDWEDTDNGYVGGSWKFESPIYGYFTLYFRWGVPRIGGVNDTHVGTFEEWLTERVRETLEMTG